MELTALEPVRPLRIEKPAAHAVLKSWGEDSDTTSQSAFVVSESKEKKFAIVNHANEYTFSVWSVSSDKTPKLEAQIATTPMPSSTYVSTVLQLPNNQALLVISTYPRRSEALAILSYETGALTTFANPDPDTMDPTLYVRAYALDNRTLIVHYTGQTRIAAELYLNQYTHISLLPPATSKPIELLTLSIDDGSLSKIFIVNKTLYGEGYKRGEKSKLFRWALDITKAE